MGVSNFITLLPGAECGRLVYGLAEHSGSYNSPWGVGRHLDLQFTFSEQKDLSFVPLESSIDQGCPPTFSCSTDLHHREENLPFVLDWTRAGGDQGQKSTHQQKQATDLADHSIKSLAVSWSTDFGHGRKTAFFESR